MVEAIVMTCLRVPDDEKHMMFLQSSCKFAVAARAAENGLHRSARLKITRIDTGRGASCLDAELLRDLLSKLQRLYSKPH